MTPVGTGDHHHNEDMPDQDLHPSWSRTEQLLEQARGSLTDSRDDALGEYRHYVDHNELGLAFEVLVDVADRKRAPSSTWEALAAAAREMGIEEDDQVHGPSRRVVAEHLTRGQAWFELRDLLNSWDPIGIYDPETAFPADEYDCLYGPLMVRLRRGDRPSDIGGFLSQQLRDHFGLDPAPASPNEFAERLVAWFSGRRAGRFHHEM